MLSQLVYSSRRRCPQAEQIQMQDTILAVSRRNNTRDGVTGFLLIDRCLFFQVLEGERACIMATYDRIQRDRRHSDVSLMSLRDIGARAFPDWSMLGLVRSPAHQAIFSRHRMTGTLDPDHVTAPGLVALAMDLQDHDRAAASPVLDAA